MPLPVKGGKAASQRLTPRRSADNNLIATDRSLSQNASSVGAFPTSFARQQPLFVAPGNGNPIALQVSQHLGLRSRPPSVCVAMPAAIARDQLVSGDETPLIPVRAVLKPASAQATVMPDLFAHQAILRGTSPIFIRGLRPPAGSPCSCSGPFS